jgi:phosphoribosylformylglycinamidine synthase I
MKPRICVIQFPGANCEYETARALRAAGLGADILRWNRTDRDLGLYRGYVLPGGFSYEDRVRAGAVAATEDIMAEIMQEAAQGKPVIGICNGAQVLVECGLVPGSPGGRIDLALAPNRGMGREGYYSDWVFVEAPPVPARCAATCDLEPGEVLPLPVAHAQGRFTSDYPGLFEKLEAEGRIVFKYCRADGSAPTGFPEDPNGSEKHAAAVSNSEGNVVAMMPHPERAAWLHQVPASLGSPWSRTRSEVRAWKDMEGPGPGLRIFRSLKRYVEERAE